MLVQSFLLQYSYANHTGAYALANHPYYACADANRLYLSTVVMLDSYPYYSAADYAAIHVASGPDAFLWQ